MSGCYPTELRCNCDCHSTGIKTIKTSLPAQACCECDVIEVKESLSLCKHLRPVKLGCTQCYYESFDNDLRETLEKRIEALEKQDKWLYVENEERKRYHNYLNDAHKTSMEKIKALEKERDKGIERIKKLEEWITRFIERFNYIYANIGSILNEDIYALKERLEALESKQSPEQYNKVETAPELRDELRLSQKESKQSKQNIAYDLSKGLPLSSDMAMKILNGESNLAQQNPVADVAQEWQCDSCKVFFPNDYIHMIYECHPQPEKDHIPDSGKEIQNHPVCTDLKKDEYKTVSVYDAIRALREGKKIRAATHKGDKWAFLGCDDFGGCMLNVQVDDWIIKDE